MARAPQSPQLALHTPQPTKGVIGLIAVCAICWLAAVIFEPLRTVVIDSMLLDATTIPQLELWGVITHAIFPREFFALVLSGLMLWLFGSDVARRTGDAKWLGVMVLATLVGGTLGALIAWPFGGPMQISGPGAAVSASIAMYCWNIWNRRTHLFFLELTGKSMLGLFLAIDFVMALFSLNPTHLLVQLGGALVGLAAASGTWRPSLLKRHYHYWRVKRNLKIVARTPETDDRRRKKDGTWIN